MKKHMIFIALSIIFISLLTGCGFKVQEIELKEEKKQVVLEFGWWGNDPRHVYTIEAIQKFEELYPYIKVNLDYGEFSNYETRWNIKMKAHIEPDVMQINYAWMKNASSDGSAFYDINQLSDTIDLSSFSDTSISYGTIGDSLNALPIALNSKSFVYDKQVFDSYGLELPKTWEDIFHVADIMSKDGLYVLDLELSTAWFVLESYIEQKTGKEFITNGQLNLTKEDAIEMLSFYVSLVERGVTQDFTTRNNSHFSDGTYVGSALWIVDTPRYEAMLPEGHTFTVGSYPMMDHAKRSGRYTKPATMYAVSANTKYPKESALLLDFLLNSEDMALLQQTEKGVPESSKQLEVLKKEGKLDGILYESASQLGEQDDYLIDPNYENNGIRDSLKSAVDSVFYNNVSIETAAEEFYAAIENAVN